MKWTRFQEEHDCLPIVDSYVDKEVIYKVTIDEVEFFNDSGDILFAGPPRVCFPHLFMLQRPFADLFGVGGCISEINEDTQQEECLAAIWRLIFLQRPSRQETIGDLYRLYTAETLSCKR